MAFKEIKEVKINTQSFSNFFNSQTTNIDKGYNNYLLGQRQDCTMNSLFKYDINNIKDEGMSQDDKYFLGILKEKFGWSDSSKTFAPDSVLKGDYEVLVTEINDTKNTLSMG